MAKLDMALRGFNSAVAGQLTEEMLVVEEKPEPLESMD